MQILDGYLIKYGASVVALLVYAAPLYFRDPALRASQADLTQVPPHPRGLCLFAGDVSNVW